MKNLKSIIYNILLVASIVVISVRCYQYYEFSKDDYSELPQVHKSYIDAFVRIAKTKGVWNGVMQKRFDAIEEIKLVKNYKMPVTRIDGEIKVHAIGRTRYKIVDGVLLPKNIHISDLTLYDGNLLMITVWHELGHAILFQDDISDDSVYNNQIMWYQRHDDMCVFNDENLVAMKLIEMFETPPSKELIKEMLNNAEMERSLEHSCNLHMLLNDK